MHAAAYVAVRATVLLLAGSACGFVASPVAAQCQKQRLESATPSNNAQFGFSLSAGDGLLAVGAPLGQAPGQIGGFVHLFERRWNGWHEVERLAPPHSQIFLFYGYCTRLAGGRLFVGAPGEPGLISVGLVYVYERVGGAWTLDATLSASTPTAFDSFGACIDVAPSGDTLVIGSAGDDERGNDAGAAYVFERQNGAWSEAQTLFASDAATLDAFGFPSVLADGRIYIGARSADAPGAGGEDVGAVYVFERDGGRWTQTAKLVPDPPMRAAGFGTSIAVEGERVLVGGSDFFDPDDEGGAWVFERVAGAWESTALVAEDPAWKSLGRSVELAGDRAIVLGEYRWSEDDLDVELGGALVFEKTEHGWEPQNRRLIPITQDGSILTAMAAVGDELFLGETLAGVGNHPTAGRVHRLALDGDCGIAAAQPRVSISSNDPRQAILVHAGAEYAGYFYLVLGSSHGPLPGFDFGGVHVPLNPDHYFGLTLTRFNSGWFTDNFGVLDENGQATVILDVGPHPFSVLQGSSASHAALVFDPFTSELVHATNRTTLQLSR